MTQVKKQIIVMAKSTIAIILKNRGTIKKADFYRGVTVIIKQRADD